MADMMPSTRRRTGGSSTTARRGTPRPVGASATSTDGGSPSPSSATKPSGWPPGCTIEGIGTGTVVCWQLPTGIDTLVLLVALARLGAVQCPIIPILREREVRYITNEAKCDVLHRPTAVARLRLRGAGRGRSRRDRLHACWRPTRCPPAIRARSPPARRRVRARQALAVLHVGVDGRPQGRVAHRPRRSWPRATRGLTRMQPDRPTTCTRSAFPVAHIGGASMLVAALHDRDDHDPGRGVRRRAVAAVHGRAGRDAPRDRGAVLPARTSPPSAGTASETLFPRLRDVRRRRRAHAARARTRT